MSIDDEAKSIVSGFSFIGILISFFLTGFAFVFLVLPLLTEPLNGVQPLVRFNDLLMILRTDWSLPFAKSSQLPVVAMCFIYLLMIFIVGFSLQPIANIYIWIAGEFLTFVWPTMRKLVMLVARVKGKDWNGIHERIEFFQPLGIRKAYAEFVDRLHKEKQIKLVWEWELFNYYVSCGIALSMSCLFLAAFVRNIWLRASLPLLSQEVLRLPLILLLGFAVAMLNAFVRSRTLRILYDFYK